MSVNIAAQACLRRRREVMGKLWLRDITAAGSVTGWAHLQILVSSSPSKRATECVTLVCEGQWVTKSRNQMFLDDHKPPPTHTHTFAFIGARLYVRVHTCGQCGGTVSPSVDGPPLRCSGCSSRMKWASAGCVSPEPPPHCYAQTQMWVRKKTRKNSTIKAYKDSFLCIDQPVLSQKEKNRRQDDWQREEPL